MTGLAEAESMQIGGDRGPVRGLPSGERVVMLVGRDLVADASELVPVPDLLAEGRGEW